MGMSGEEPHSFPFGAIVQALARAGDASSTSRWLDEAVKMQVDDSTACSGYVLIACARAGDVEAAERWLNACKPCRSMLFPTVQYSARGKKRVLGEALPW